MNPQAPPDWSLPGEDRREEHRGHAVAVAAGGDPEEAIATWDYQGALEPEQDIDLYPACSCGWRGTALRVTAEQIAAARTADRIAGGTEWGWMRRIEDGGGGPHDRWIDHAVTAADQQIPRPS